MDAARPSIIQVGRDASTTATPLVWDTVLFESDPGNVLSYTGSNVIVAAAGLCRVKATLTVEVSTTMSVYAQIKRDRGGTITNLHYAYAYLAASGHRETVTLESWVTVQSGDKFYMEYGIHSGTGTVTAVSGGGGWVKNMTVEHYPS